MERVSSISARLKEYRNLNDMTLSDLSKMTGIPAQTLNRYELGQRIPKIDVATEIAESLSVNPLWMQGYDVTMEKSVHDILLKTAQEAVYAQEFSELTEAEQIRALASVKNPASLAGDGWNPSDFELLEAFRSAPDYKKDAIRDLLGLK